MANESTVSSVTATLIDRIIDDAYFLAEQTAIMPALVTNLNASGMEPRRHGVYPQATASEVGEGSATGSYVELTKTVNSTLTPKIAQIEGYLTDERVETDPDDAATAMSNMLGLGVARKIDTDLTEEFANFTTTKGDAGSALTISAVAAAIAVLHNNNTPNPMHVVLHPYKWHSVWTALGQPATNAAFLGEVANEALRDYYTGTFLGANWYTDGNIGTANTGGTAYSAAFHSEALALDTRKPLTFEMQREAQKRSTILVANSKYATGVRKDEHGVALLGDITEPS